MEAVPTLAPSSGFAPRCDNRRGAIAVAASPMVLGWTDRATLSSVAPMDFKLDELVLFGFHERNVLQAAGRLARRVTVRSPPRPTQSIPRAHSNGRRHRPSVVRSRC